MKAMPHNARDVTIAFVVPAIKKRAAMDGCLMTQVTEDELIH